MQHRKDAEQLLIKNIDEKCFALRLALAKEKKKREVCNSMRWAAVFIVSMFVGFGGISW